MKVLVTGGTGFIASYVVQRLAEVGHEPVIFDRHIKNSPHEWIMGDVRDATAVTEAVAHVDAVMHLAGVLGTQETISNPRPAAETNVLGGLNVFEAVAQYGCPAVYIAVGNHWERNTYSITKTCAEWFAQMFTQYRDTPIAVVRALNAYGPGQKAPQPWGTSRVRKIVPTFVCQALSGSPIEVYGTGAQIMDMIHVRDVAKVLVRALEVGPHPDGIAYEAGTGRPTSVNDVAAVVAQAVGDVEIKRLAMRPGESASRPVLGDPETLTPLFGERPALVPLDEGIAETVGWYRGCLRF